LAAPGSVGPTGYRHEAFFYAGIDGFVEGIVPFIRDGVAAGEPVLVVVSSEKIRRLREALGDDAEQVLFAEMEYVGANPARIIPAWREFIAEHGGPGRSVRGVGEPIHPDRSADELAECHRHEALLNLAFADTPGFWLLCPYDTTGLPEEVLHEATRTHPYVADGDEHRESDLYLGEDAIAAPFGDPLPRPPGAFNAFAFDAETLSVIRRFVADHAAEAGLPEDRIADLVVAMSEIATNSVRYGGGTGVLRTWTEGDTFICEVRDRGGVVDPLAGRVQPSPTQIDGRGLWLANQLCDLVQVRAFATGGAVRVHVRR
jgi:anti-sigma regulatory factor (Ser/Thr protein kinase)